MKVLSWNLTWPGLPLLHIKVHLETMINRDCNIALACLASHMIPLAVLPTAVDTIESISSSPSWKARGAILEFLQVTTELNYILFFIL